MHAQRHTHTHSTHTHVHTHTHTHSHKHTHTGIHTHMHTHTQARTHAHTHAYTLTLTQAHTHARARARTQETAQGELAQLLQWLLRSSRTEYEEALGRNQSMSQGWCQQTIINDVSPQSSLAVPPPPPPPPSLSVSSLWKPGPGRGGVTQHDAGPPQHFRDSAPRHRVLTPY